MNDCELNAKMADLCKRTLVEGLEGTYVEPLGFVGEETCRTAAGREIVVWNPIGDWRQAMECVVKAVTAQGCGFVLSRADTWYVMFDGLALEGHEHEDAYPIRTTAGLEQVPRAICEAALEAFKKLEADDAK